MEEVIANLKGCHQKVVDVANSRHAAGLSDQSCQKLHGVYFWQTAQIGRGKGLGFESYW